MIEGLSPFCCDAAAPAAAGGNTRLTDHDKTPSLDSVWWKIRSQRVANLAEGLAQPRSYSGANPVNHNHILSNYKKTKTFAHVSVANNETFHNEFKESFSAGCRCRRIFVRRYCTGFSC